MALPDDQDAPAVRAEGGRILSVAGFVGLTLGLPKRGVGLGFDAAVFAGVHVPKTPVDKSNQKSKIKEQKCGQPCRLA